MFKPRFLLFVALFTLITALPTAAQTVWQTRILSNQLRTLQVYPAGEPLELPLITLSGDRQILISFDDMNYMTKNYGYRVIHCDADWQESRLIRSDFLDGFQTGTIDGQLSQNTTTLYANYQLTLPNSDISLKVSGNYAVIIAEDSDFDHPAAVACFSVVEPMVTIEAGITGNTDIELIGRYQQLEFSIVHPNYEIRDPFSELTVKVTQNRRNDNAVTGLKPTYTAAGRQTFKNNRALIFEGGNQYRTADFSSEYTYSGSVDRIDYDNKDGGGYHVFLMPAGARTGHGAPSTGFDADGRYIVNRQRVNDVSIESDYMWVHFILPMESPRFDGSFYVMGDVAQNRLDADARMDYDYQAKVYHKALFLKQGGASYLFGFVAKGEQKASFQNFEGSYWQTENEYVIYVYHRPWGERYDKLVGYYIQK